MRTKEVVVRIPVGRDVMTGALFCVGEVPENAMLVLLQCPRCVDQAGQCIGRTGAGAIRQPGRGGCRLARSC